LSLTTIVFLLQGVLVLFTGVELRVGGANAAVAGAVVELEAPPGVIVKFEMVEFDIGDTVGVTAVEFIGDGAVEFKGAGAIVGLMVAIEVAGAAVEFKIVELEGAGATVELTATVGALEVELETPGNTVELTGIVVFEAPALGIVVVLVAFILPTGMATGGDVAFGAPGGGIVVAFDGLVLVVAFVVPTLPVVVPFVALKLCTDTGAPVGNASTVPATGGNVGTVNMLVTGVVSNTLSLAIVQL
jgi:hypothetical protein